MIFICKLVYRTRGSRSGKLPPDDLGFRPSRGRKGPVEGGTSMGKLLLVTGVILAFILLLVFIFPSQPEKEEPVKAKK